MSLRIGLVGCGAIASTHIQSILSAGGNIHALCDIDISRAQALVKAFGLQDVAICQTYQDMIDSVPLDVVHICTPHYLHAPMAAEALQKGIHVLCEKPLCISLSQLEMLQEATKAGKAQLGVCHQNRYEPNMRRLKELCAQGVKGGIGEVVWDRDAAYYNSAAWRGTWEMEGGGVMINQALHTLDLMQWICGMPVSVTAHVSTDTLSDVMETEDTAMARFRLPDGHAFHMFATVTSSVNFSPLIRVQTASGESIDARNELLVHESTLVDTPMRQNFGSKTEWGTGHRLLIDDFYHCIQTDTPFAIDIQEGAKVVRMILAMYRSHGKAVEIQ